VRKTSSKMWVAAAGVASITLLATACSSGDGGSDDSSSAPSDEKVTLSVATFNEFGYTDLYKEYMADHPNVTIKSNKIDTSDNARLAVQNAIATDTVADDIVAADGDWMPELLASSDFFLDLGSDSVTDRWPDWKTEMATDPDGKLIGYGTDSGPEAICYRKDLFEAAGLASDRESVAKLLDGDWDNYFKVGQQFMASAPAGVAWFDSIGALSQGMVNQQKAPFEDPESGDITVLDADSPTKAIYDQLTSPEVLAESAHLKQWTPEWNDAFKGDKFATQLCPPWMTQIIAGNAPDQTNWDVADVMPGGASNWGGSYLLVPEGGKNAQAAKDLADWLTAPEQAAKVFVQYGNFPSQTEATTNADVVAKTDDYFGGAPTGEIFSNRFAPIATQPFRGEQYFPINAALGDAYTRVDVDKTDDSASSWAKFETAVNDLG